MQQLVSYFKNKNLSDSSILTYIRNLKQLNDNNDFDNLNFLYDINKINSHLSSKKTNTIKNYYISIVSALSDPKFNKSQKAHKLKAYYTKKMNELNDKIINTYKIGDKSEKEDKNWTTWEDVIKKRDELVNEIQPYKDKQKLNQKEYQTLLKAVVLSLYSYIPPRRNDYYKMFICMDDPVDNSVNWFCYNKKKFIFNDFKTSKTEGQLVIDIPDDLMRVLTIYIIHHPGVMGDINNETCDPFLVYCNGDPIEKNAITYILNSIFKPLKIGSSMLRHIYLSDKYGDQMKEKEQDAKMMSHSVATQEGVYIKK